MIFHSSSSQIDGINGYTTSKLWDSSFFYYYNCIHVARNKSQNTFQCMENQGKLWNELLSFILMNFHSSSPKTDCKNENTTFKLWEKSLFDFYISIHAINMSQDNFQTWWFYKLVMLHQSQKKVSSIREIWLHCYC